MYKSVTEGIALAVALIIPIAALVALVYRFPVPFGGYVSGLEGMGKAAVAVLFYAAFGGIVVLLAIGTAAGVIARVVAPRPDGSRPPILFVLCILGDLLAALYLAVLDKLIGPW